MDKVNQYTLIEFPDKSTDVVPDNWLFGQKCYWPKYTQEKLKVAVKRQEPVQAGWKLFEPVRLLKKCGKNVFLFFILFIYIIFIISMH